MRQKGSTVELYLCFSPKRNIVNTVPASTITVFASTFVSTLDTPVWGENKKNKQYVVSEIYQWNDKIRQNLNPKQNKNKTKAKLSPSILPRILFTAAAQPPLKHPRKKKNRICQSLIDTFPKERERNEQKKKVQILFFIPYQVIPTLNLVSTMMFLIPV